MSETGMVLLSVLLMAGMLLAVTWKVINALLQTQAVLLKTDRREQHMAERLAEKFLNKPVDGIQIVGLHSSERATEAHDDAVTERSKTTVPRPAPAPVGHNGFTDMPYQ